MVGTVYKFKVRATNYAGSLDSSALSVALASLPAKPTTPPTSDPQITGQDRIGIAIAAFDDSLNGGSPILIYNIQYDDGNRGDYRDIFTLSPTHTISGVEAGAQYRFRYRARNFNGWGPLSDIRYILAATVPDAPDAPRYTSSTSSSITFGLVPPADNGGSALTSFRLYYDVIGSAPAYQLIYEGTDLTVTVSTSDGLVAGSTYRFVLHAVNQFGESVQSEETVVALGRLPEQPSAPYKIESASSQTNIVVAWNQVPDIDGIPTLGYKLMMDDGLNGDFQVIYDGSVDYHTRQFTAVGLETGLPYRFKVIAVNINGESPESDEFPIYACLKPSDNGTPYKIDTTRTTITIGWDEPDAQGCPLTSFGILRDSGVRDDIIIPVDPAIVGDKPSMREYMVTGLTLPGNTYRFVVRAFNDADSSDSDVLSVILSAVPDTPVNGPTSDASVTDESRIKVNFGPQPASENGGSPILSYDLQVDYGYGGDFLSLIGGEGMEDSLETRFTVETNIVSGAMYRFRYRSENANGWSAYSPISYIKAAAKPARPPAPIFLDATATSVELGLF